MKTPFSKFASAGALLCALSASALAADYSQVELRLLAHLSSDPLLIDAFNHGGDVHALTAREIFKVPTNEEVTKDQRRAAKAINFGVIYGQSDYGLARDLGITKTEARAFIDSYFERGIMVLVKEAVNDEDTRMTIWSLDDDPVNAAIDVNFVVASDTHVSVGVPEIARLPGHPAEGDFLISQRDFFEVDLPLQLEAWRSGDRP